MFWSFYTRHPSQDDIGPSYIDYKMIDLVEIYQMKQEIYKQKVDSYVISSIWVTAR
jgi:hypothetical protein